MLRLNEENLNNIKNWDKEWLRYLKARFINGEIITPKSSKRFGYIETKIKENDKVLDVGCGLTEFLHEIKKRKKIEGYGIDYSRFAIEKAKSLYPEIKWIVGDAYNTKLEDNFFDIAIGSEIIEHLERPDLLIKEMNRVVKNGGYIVLSTPHIKGYKYHIWVFNDDDVKKMLEPYGKVEVKRVPEHFIVASCRVKK